MTNAEVAYACTLSEEDKQHVAVNLKESENERAKKIEEVRRWIEDSNDLNAPTDDFFILRFLRACKYDMEKTKRKFRNYFLQRTNAPEWYSKRDSSLVEIQEILELGTFLPLKKADDKGRMIVIIRTCLHNPSKQKINNVLKACLMVLDLAIRDHEKVTIYGIVAILDMNGATFGHAFQLQPTVVKKLVHAWQGCYPLRIQSLDFVNAPIYINVVLKVFRQFMNQKLKQRLHVHMGNSKDFFNKIPSNILPAEYGGTDGTIEELKDYWKKMVEDNKQWFVKDEQYRINSLD